MEQEYDVIVYGAGYVGCGAALRLQTRGLQVLLVDASLDLLWESGRAMQTQVGSCDDKDWREWWRLASDLGGCRDAIIGPAQAEIAMAELVHRRGLPLVGYVQGLRPVLQESRLRALVVASKGGLRCLRARAWVDTTEQGLLLRLCGASATPRPVRRWQAWAFFQGPEAGPPPGMQATARSGEGALLLPDPDPLAPWLGLPAALEGMPDAQREYQLSHASWRSLPQYEQAATSISGLPDNVTCAAPAWSAVPVDDGAQRWRLGVQVAEGLQPVPETSAVPVDLDAAWPELPSREADVVVVGAGTGGALAALAAARAGARTLALDSNNVPGGIGTAGGIHGLYYGFAGGLQDEVDDRVEQLMRRHPAFTQHVVPVFHYFAKAIVLEQMLREAGVERSYGSRLAAVDTAAGRVRAALIATPEGPVRWRAPAWIDGSGDGDLCLMAGAEARRGRQGDGRYHAFSQSGGRLLERDGKRVMMLINFDAGRCDPHDYEDLSRGRLHAIRHLARKPPGIEAADLTYVAPVLGLRQGPQIVTDSTLTLDDLLAGRVFDDAIAYHGCHLDNHSLDLHLESDDAILWTWAYRNWRSSCAVTVSYRNLLPQGIDNVWIASRCLGVSQDAHYSLRQQRDMQRIGEAAGLAAAQAAAAGVGARAIDLEALREALRSSGAWRLPDTSRTRFGPQGDATLLQRPPPDLASDLAAIDTAAGGPALWRLRRQRQLCELAIRERLGSPQPTVSWFAALVAIDWGWPEVRERLHQAVRSGEWGYDDQTATQLAPRFAKSEGTDPWGNTHLVPNWLCAICLLRRCGDDSSVELLADVARSNRHSLSTRQAIALTLERLAAIAPEQAPLALVSLTELLCEPIPGAVLGPRQGLGAVAERARQGLDVEVDEHPAAQDEHPALERLVARARQAWS